MGVRMPSHRHFGVDWYGCVCRWLVVGRLLQRCEVGQFFRAVCFKARVGMVFGFSWEFGGELAFGGRCVEFWCWCRRLASDEVFVWELGVRRACTPSWPRSCVGVVFVVVLAPVVVAFGGLLSSSVV